VDEPGAEAEAPRPKAGPWRAILITFVCASAFGIGLFSYLRKATQITDAPLLVATPDADAPRPGADTLALAQRVAAAFVEALHVGDTAGAYAQMARPYRESATLDTFRAAWRTPLLASPRAVRLTRTSERAVPIDGKLVKAATFSATGAILYGAGALETTFTFLREGDDARVLAVFVGGVPIVQGLGPSPSQGLGPSLPSAPP
jgi:hypothetical protein